LYSKTCTPKRCLGLICRCIYENKRRSEEEEKKREKKQSVDIHIYTYIHNLSFHTFTRNVLLSTGDILLSSVSAYKVISCSFTLLCSPINDSGRSNLTGDPYRTGENSLLTGDIGLSLDRPRFSISSSREIKVTPDKRGGDPTLEGEFPREPPPLLPVLDDGDRLRRAVRSNGFSIYPISPEKRYRGIINIYIHMYGNDKTLK
jgi:hypothetical protein